MRGGTELKLQGYLFLAAAVVLDLWFEVPEAALALLILGFAYIFAGDVLNAVRNGS